MVDTLQFYSVFKKVDVSFIPIKLNGVGYDLTKFCLEKRKVLIELGLFRLVEGF